MEIRKEYYPNGQLQYKLQCSTDYSHYQEYYKNGDLSDQYIKKNNQLYGIDETFIWNQRISIQQWKRDRLHGLDINFR